LRIIILMLRASEYSASSSVSGENICFVIPSCHFRTVPGPGVLKTDPALGHELPRKFRPTPTEIASTTIDEDAYEASLESKVEEREFVMTELQKETAMRDVEKQAKLIKQTLQFFNKAERENMIEGLIDKELGVLKELARQILELDDGSRKEELQFRVMQSEKMLMELRKLLRIDEAGGEQSEDSAPSWSGTAASEHYDTLLSHLLPKEDKQQPMRDLSIGPSDTPSPRMENMDRILSHKEYERMLTDMVPKNSSIVGGHQGWTPMLSIAIESVIDGSQSIGSCSESDVSTSCFANDLITNEEMMSGLAARLQFRMSEIADEKTVKILNELSLHIRAQITPVMLQMAQVRDMRRSVENTASL